MGRRSLLAWLEYISASSLLALGGVALGWTLWMNWGNPKVMIGVPLTAALLIVGCFRSLSRRVPHG